ncbi:hypothetical protein [Nocardia wallacei]|uniref:hypothetical protein n=1 Tax=Nocardia wallacei TaxID=480035 RepID=UPI0024569818|nr:hypothetical protein [Nocardia wallacei]
MFCTLLYLNGKSKVFKTLVEGSGTGGLGDLLSGNRTGNIRELADASFGTAAMFATIAALGSVLITLTCMMPIRRTGPTTDVPAEPRPGNSA